MAYASTGLSGPHYFGGLQAKKLWFYDTLDSVATVTGANYFNDTIAPRGFNVGDVIIVTFWATAIGSGGTVQGVENFYVSSVVTTDPRIPAELFSADDGAATVLSMTSLLDNFTATGDPAVGNDTSQGYQAGSKWLNTTTMEMWTCKSAALGAAVWEADDPVTIGFSAVSLLANGTAVSVTPGFKFRIASFLSVTRAVNTTLGVATTVTVEIGVTAVGGLSITMASGDVAGATYGGPTTADATSVGSSSAVINIVVGTHASTTGSADMTLVLKKTT